MRIIEIFFINIEVTILVVKKDNFFNKEMYAMYVNDVFLKDVTLTECSILNQSKKMDEIAIQTNTFLRELEDVDFEKNKVEIK